MQAAANVVPLPRQREGHLAGLANGSVEPALPLAQRSFSTWLTVPEVSELTGDSERTIQRRCQDGYYSTRRVTVRGDADGVYEIRLDSLPMSDQVRYWWKQTATATAPATTGELAEVARRIALARADLVRHYLREVVEVASEIPLVMRKKAFVGQYNHGMWPERLAEVGRISFPTLERWRKQLQDARGDASVLAPKYVAPKKGARGVTDQMAAVILECALQANRRKISEVIRDARKRWAELGIADEVSDDTVRRWLDDFKRDHADVWTFVREGKKALVDKHLPYITRDRTLIEAGDLVVADGHTFNFTILNPATGKPKRMTLVLVTDFRSGYPLGWEIMPTENTAAIASAYRRTILRLGFIPRVFYLDNGRAFRAKFFKGCPDFDSAGLLGLFERLGCQVTHAMPYHGQSKPVERFFGSLGDFERTIPTYCGTGINDKPAHMNRGERWHRSLRDEILGEMCAPTLEQIHHRLAAWVDEFVARPSDGLDGYTPLEVLSESIERVRAKPDFATRRIPPEADLAVLMMAQQVVTLYQDGIRFNGRSYYHDDLYRLDKGRGTVQLVIRYDLQNLDYVHVFDRTGRYVCRATARQKLHPAARVLGTPQNVLELDRELSRTRTLERHTQMTARALIAGELARTTPIIELPEDEPNDAVPELPPEPERRRYYMWESDMEDE